MIDRLQKPLIDSLLGSNKAIIMLGARQVGKSTLLKQVFAQMPDVLWLNGDDLDVRDLLANVTSTRLRALIGNHRYVVIDEAQRIPDVGLKLKLITDQIPTAQVIATGSSSFELASRVSESLTGRKRELRIFPLTFQEMVGHTSLLEEHRMISHRMVYGYYPEVVTSPGSEEVVLRELSDSYLYKDILSLDGIAKPEKLVGLLQALARQIGSQVSYNEVGQLVGLNPRTVERYVDVLEKCFIIFRLGSFSRNLRNELKQSRKVYFWDMGIRNAIISDFRQVESRDDVGAMWENFVIAELLKKQSIEAKWVNTWFWRTQQKQEIDLVQEHNGQITAFEIKWNPKKAGTRCPVSFAKAYPEAKYQVITPENFDELVL